MFREAIANAVAHRDWDDSRVVTIEHDPWVGGFSVDSPGRLLESVSLSNMLTCFPAARSPHMRAVLAAFGYGTAKGGGMRRMYRALLVRGQRPPVVSLVGAGETRVRIGVAGMFTNPGMGQLLTVWTTRRAVTH